MCFPRLYKIVSKAFFTKMFDSLFILLYPIVRILKLPKRCGIPHHFKVEQDFNFKNLKIAKSTNLKSTIQNMKFKIFLKMIERY